MIGRDELGAGVGVASACRSFGIDQGHAPRRGRSYAPALCGGQGIGARPTTLTWRGGHNEAAEIWWRGGMSCVPSGVGGLQTGAGEGGP